MVHVLLSSFCLVKSFEEKEQERMVPPTLCAFTIYIYIYSLHPWHVIHRNPQTAYNFFYRDERARILAMRQKQQQEAEAEAEEQERQVKRGQQEGDRQGTNKYQKKNPPLKKRRRRESSTTASATDATSGPSSARRENNTSSTSTSTGGTQSAQAGQGQSRSQGIASAANYISNVEASSSSARASSSSGSSLNPSSGSSDQGTSSGPSSGASAAPSSSGSVADTCSKDGTDTISSNNSTSGGSSSEQGKAGSTCTSASGEDTPRINSGHINGKKREHPTSLLSSNQQEQRQQDQHDDKIRAQSMQHAGMTKAAIAALVEHQTSFRNMGREIAKRWKTIGVLDLDRYQRLAQQDAERYKREIAEYEAEQKRREAIVKKVTEAAAAALGGATTTTTTTTTSGGGGGDLQQGHIAANTNATTSGMLPSMLPWAGLQQAQPPPLTQQSMQHHQPPPSIHAQAALPASVPSTAQQQQVPSTADANTNINSGLQAPVIAQLLQYQQQLLGLDPSPEQWRAFQSALTVPSSRQQNEAGQGQVVQLLMHQNQFLQQYILDLQDRQQNNSTAPPSSQHSFNSLFALAGDNISGSSCRSGPPGFVLPSLPPFPPVASVEAPQVSTKVNPSDSKASNLHRKRSAKTDEATNQEPEKKKAKKKRGIGNTSISEASRGLLSLRSNDTGLSSLSTLTSFKADTDKDKKDEISDLSTSASDGRKKTSDSSDTSSKEDDNEPKAKIDNNNNNNNNNNNEEAVSDVSASGESDDYCREHRHSEGTDTSSNNTSSNASSSPENGKNDSVPTGTDERSHVKSLARSGSDSGELSSESSWVSSEDGPNTTEGEGGLRSSPNGSTARVVKNTRMYSSEMSSVSASGSDSGNVSSHCSDDDKNGDGKPRKTLQTK